MTIKGNNGILGKHYLFHTITAALFSVTLIFGASGVVGSPLQQEAYASSQALPIQTTPSSQVPPPTSICNPNSPELRIQSSGAKVAELQRYLVQLGYGSLLGQSGIDGKFGLSTQNAVKKFQVDAGLQPVDGIVGPRTWGVLCELMTSVAAAPIEQQQQQQQQPPQQQQEEEQPCDGIYFSGPSGVTKCM